jgi:hypothetical protein
MVNSFPSVTRRCRNMFDEICIDDNSAVLSATDLRSLKQFILRILKSVEEIQFFFFVNKLEGSNLGKGELYVHFFYQNWKTFLKICQNSVLQAKILHALIS